MPRLHVSQAATSPCAWIAAAPSRASGSTPILPQSAVGTVSNAMKSAAPRARTRHRVFSAVTVNRQEVQHENQTLRIYVSPFRFASAAVGNGAAGAAGRFAAIWLWSRPVAHVGRRLGNV